MNFNTEQNLFTADNEVTLNNDARKQYLSSDKTCMRSGVGDYNFGNNSGIIWAGFSVAM
jgi:hypothetical protein